MKRWLTWISGPLLAAFFLWLCFRGVDRANLAQALQHINPLLLCAAMATVVIHLLLRAQRWRTFLAPVRGDRPFRELFSAVAIGYMASLLPGRVGEVLRPALLARRTTTPFGAALATVGAERVICDLLAVLGAGAIGLMLPVELSGLGGLKDPSRLHTMRAAGAIALLVTLGVLVAAWWVARREARAVVWLEEMSRRSPSALRRKVWTWLSTLPPGLKAMASLRGLARLALETLLIWGVIALGIHVGVRACNIDLAPFGSLILLPILAVGIGIPTPGGTGSYHAAMMIGLYELMGVDQAAAFGAALVVHAASWLPVVVLGGVCAALGGLRATGAGASVTPGEALP